MRWAFTRRDLLRRLGVGIGCLPLLQAGRSRAAGPQKTFICVAQTQGYRQAQWRPEPGSLANQTLPSSSSPLEPHKQDVIFLPDLTNPHYTGYNEPAYPTIYYGLPDRTTPGNWGVPNGKTVDQVVAGALTGTPLPSLALHVQIDLPPPLTRQPGFDRCFWRGAAEPVVPQGDPVATYQRLFAGVERPKDDPAVKRLLIERKSMLDYVGKSLERLGARLGTQDRMAVAAHLDAIRGVERQLSRPIDTPPNCAGTAPAAVDLKVSLNYPKVLAAQMELAMAALRCGLTRVVTLQMANATGASVDFAFLPGIPARGTGYRSAFRNWSDVGHNPVLGGVDHKLIVDRWCMEQLAGLLAKLRAMPFLGGVMLDESVVLWGNHMKEGDRPVLREVPWILAGSGGGYFRTGQCASSAGKPLTGVLSEICRAMGVTDNPFGPPLDGLRRA